METSAADRSPVVYSFDSFTGRCAAHSPGCSGKSSRRAPTHKVMNLCCFTSEACSSQLCCMCVHSRGRLGLPRGCNVGLSADSFLRAGGQDLLHRPVAVTEQVQSCCFCWHLWSPCHHDCYFGEHSHKTCYCLSTTVTATMLHGIQLLLP